MITRYSSARGRHDLAGLAPDRSSHPFRFHRLASLAASSTPQELLQHLVDGEAGRLPGGGNSWNVFKKLPHLALRQESWFRAFPAFVETALTTKNVPWLRQLPPGHDIS